MNAWKTCVMDMVIVTIRKDPTRVHVMTVGKELLVKLIEMNVIFHLFAVITEHVTTIQVVIIAHALQAGMGVTVKLTLMSA